MNTLGYIRVSTRDQAENGLSLDAQQSAVEDYCKLYSLGPLEIITDRGLSAKSVVGRPGMQDLLERIDRGEVGAVVVYKIDRLFRSIRDALAVFDTFKARGVAFHSVMEKWDTTTAAGEFALNMMLLLAQLERRQTGERTSHVLQDKKAKAGRVINGRAPYGFTWNKGELVRVDTEQDVIATITSMSDIGMGATRIARQLEFHDVRTRSGTIWDKTQVTRVLRRAGG